MRDRLPASNTSAVDRRQFLGQATIVGRGRGSRQLDVPAPAARGGRRRGGQRPHQAVDRLLVLQRGGREVGRRATCQVARQLGVTSSNCIGPEHWPTLKKHGLTCAIAPNGMPGAPFMRGFNNPKYHDGGDRQHHEDDRRLRRGRRSRRSSPSPATSSATPTIRRAARSRATKGSTTASPASRRSSAMPRRRASTSASSTSTRRDSSHPMKGHPGYQGDDVDYVADICRKVGSPRMKLLFDIYHVQIMHGDVIRRIEQHKDVIGHVHTAGNPGRGELDDTQEINYPPIMRKLLEIGYTGYVGQEFIPTRDPLAGLQQAVRLCDV